MSAQPHEGLVEMKPCPTIWCKRDDELHTYQDCTDEWVVICPSCGVNGPCAPTESKAKDAWNDRPSPIVGELVEALSLAREWVIDAANEFRGEVQLNAARDLRKIDATLSKANAIRGEEK